MPIKEAALRGREHNHALQSHQDTVPASDSGEKGPHHNVWLLFIILKILTKFDMNIGTGTF